MAKAKTVALYAPQRGELTFQDSPSVQIAYVVAREDQISEPREGEQLTV